MFLCLGVQVRLVSPTNKKSQKLEIKLYFPLFFPILQSMWAKTCSVESTKKTTTRQKMHTSKQTNKKRYNFFKFLEKLVHCVNGFAPTPLRFSVLLFRGLCFQQKFICNHVKVTVLQKVFLYYLSASQKTCFQESQKMTVRKM